MRRSTIAVLLIALIGTGLVHPIVGAPAPAPGPATQSVVLPITRQVVAPAPVVTSSGAVATAPVVQTITTPTLVNVPAQAPANSPPVVLPTTPTSGPPATAPATAPSVSGAGVATPGTNGTPAVAPARAPTTAAGANTTGTPSSAPARAPTSSTTTPAVVTNPALSPARAPSTTPANTTSSSPARAPSSSTASSPTSSTTPAGIATPGTAAQTTALAPAPAVAPSSSGFYNTTVQATNATGTFNTQQSQQFASQVQSYLASNGISTGVGVVGQSVGSSSSSAGRRLHQTTFTLNINLSIGPLSPTQAAQCKQLLNGLSINVGVIVIVVVVVVFVPIPVFIPTPSVIAQPPNTPALPPSSNITIPVAPAPPGTGGSIPSQNAPGGGTIAGVVNQNSGNIINVNSGNSVNNTVVNNNQVTNNVNNIVNNNQVTNSVVNNIVQNVNNPQTPGAATPTTPTPASPGSTTPGTTSPPASTTPATPGGATAATATTTATSLTYITQAAPPAASPPAVPSPPPSPPPSCGSQPQCRIYTRDMLCCQNEGILTPFQGAQIEILCTHPVRFAITCLATSGPTNISAASVYNNDYGYNYNFRTNIQWLGQAGGYLGKVGVDVEPARLDAARQECSLNLQTPCVQDGQIVTTMPPVQPLTFSVIDFTSFYQNYVGFPPTNAIGQFSYSWMNNTYPGGCLEQPTLTVPGSFFLGNWPNQPGFAYPCSASATFGALQQTCPTGLVQAQTGVAGIQPQQ